MKSCGFTGVLCAGIMSWPETVLNIQKQLKEVTTVHFYFSVFAKINKVKYNILISEV